jgi:hypothetical protein
VTAGPSPDSRLCYGSASTSGVGVVMPAWYATSNSPGGAPASPRCDACAPKPGRGPLTLPPPTCPPPPGLHIARRHHCRHPHIGPFWEVRTPALLKCKYVPPRWRLAALAPVVTRAQRLTVADHSGPTLGVREHGSTSPAILPHRPQAKNAALSQRSPARANTCARAAHVNPRNGSRDLTRCRLG